MRIISGKFRGRKLLKSDHLKDLRPTTDANREALFNLLNSAKFLKEINFKIENSLIIDICCGTGAVALEALSRGAKSAILIDNNKTHLDLAKSNAQMLKIEDSCQFILSDATKKLNIDNQDKQNLIFLDPPYNQDFKPIVQNLISQNILNQKSLLVIETSNNKINEIENLKILEMRNYGKTHFIFLVF